MTETDNPFAHPDLRNAILDALIATQGAVVGQPHLADTITDHLLGLGYPAKPEDTIIVDAELDIDPETALDDALTRWGSTAIPGFNPTAYVVAAEFLDTHAQAAQVIAYKPDWNLSPIHAYGILLRASETIR